MAKLDEQFMAGSGGGAPEKQNNKESLAQEQELFYKSLASRIESVIEKINENTLEEKKRNIFDVDK
jgi:hypothetical protein